jgi:hypothetical protein
MPVEVARSPSGLTAKQRIILLAALLVLAGVAVYPIWVVEYPPLLDYPNHLASSYVLAHLGDSSMPFREWYSADWGLYPFITLSAVLRALQWVLPVELAGRILLSLSVLALPLATWFFLRQANPGQDSLALWTLVATHNVFFLMCFLNFYLSLGFCFLALGLWLRWLKQPRTLGWLLAMLACTAVYASHLVGFALTGLVVAAYCLLARRPVRQWLASWAMFLPGVLCYLRFSRVMEREATGITFPRFAEKVSNLRTLFHGYSKPLDITMMFVLAACFLALWVRNAEFRWNWRWVAVSGLLFSAYWAMPVSFGIGTDLDARVLPVLLGVVFAGARVGRRGWWLAPVVVTLFFVRVENITRNFRAVEPELSDLAGSFSATPMNARVLPIIYAPPGSGILNLPFAHFWAYGVIRRHWFSPYLFDIPGLLPLRIRQSSYTINDYWTPTHGKEPDWFAIQRDYDYVWSYDSAIYFPGLDRIGQLVYSSGKLRMYRIHSPPAEAKSLGTSSPLVR